MTYKYEDQLDEYANLLMDKVEDGRLSDEKFRRLYGKLIEWMRYSKEVAGR